MIRFEHFSFRYGNDHNFALKDINLEILDGEFVIISGPSGGGKSTLCRCINGLIPHFYGGKVSGRVSVQGLDVLESSPRKLANKVGMTFQDPENQLVSSDVGREIVFGMENLGYDRELMGRRLEEALDTIGIPHLRRRVIHELSGGEKQKVAIAAVLALHPSILVMDEPTSELDPHGAEEVLSIVQRLNDELGLTVILIEHRLERVVHLVDRLVLISDGMVVADGNPRQVLAERTTFDIGVGVPPIIRLVQELRNSGIEIANVPLTVKEGRAMLERYFQRGCHYTSDYINVDHDNEILQTEKLWYAYSAGSAVIKDINIKINEGEFIAIMGRNASGKTTLVKHFNGILKPTRGNVVIDNRNTKRSTIAELASIVGFVYQNPNDHLFANTVEDELSITLKNQGWPHGKAKTTITETLERFGIDKYRQHYPRHLSGGEKQRVALASIIVAQPKILVLDEPTRGMDYSLKCDLMLYLEEYCKKGNTVILISHDVEIVAEHAERVILLSEGRVVADGGVHDVLSQALLFSPQINRLVQAFDKYGIPMNILTVREAVELLI